MDSNYERQYLENKKMIKLLNIYSTQKFLSGEHAVLDNNENWARFYQKFSAYEKSSQKKAGFLFVTSLAGSLVYFKKTKPEFSFKGRYAIYSLLGSLMVHALYSSSTKLRTLSKLNPEITILLEDPQISELGI